MKSNIIRLWAASPALFLAAFLMTGGVPSNAVAALIETSASCPGDTTCDPDVTDDYAYTFTIEETTDSLVFTATLTNTSSVDSSAVIDELYFNVNPDLELGVDFYIVNVVPDWLFTASTGGVLFDYTGDALNPQNDNRLATDESLTFDFVFTQDAVNYLLDVSGYTSVLELWTNSETSLGVGAGGGGDEGQVAVSFQTLGADGQDSDLLASNWGDGGQVPEPGPLALIGLGAIALGWVSRRSRV